MLTLLLWLGLVYLSGLVSVLSVTGRVRSALSHAAAVPVGLILYVIVFRILGGACSPWGMAGLTLTFAAGAYVAGRWIVNYDASVSRFTLVKLTLMDYLAISATLAFFLIHSCTFVGHDEINHFFFASQITNGKFPPSAYGFPTVPAKYHYGWDILLSSGYRVSGLSYPVLSDVLTTYSLAGALWLVWCLLKYLQAPLALRVLAGAGFFVGDGLAGAANYLLQGSYRKFLTLASLYYQHPWTLAVGLFLVSLVLLAYGTTAKRFRDFLFIMTWLVVLYVGVPVCSGAMIPGAGLALVTVALTYRSPGSPVPRRLVKYGVVIGAGVLLFIAWPRTGGIMIGGDAYDRPALRPALSLLGLKGYVKYQGAYVLMMPVGLAVFCYGILGALRKRWLIVRTDAVRTMLWLCVLILIPLPMILMIENCAYWDNFCKFNFIGVLAAWLLLPTVMEEARQFHRVRSHPKCARVVTLALLTSSFLTFALIVTGILTKTCTYGPRKLVSAASERFTQAVAARQHLVECISRMVDLNSNVLIANRRVTAMFPISRTTNRPEVNQQGHFREYYGDFIVIPQVTGRSIVNFYDYGFFYTRAAEYNILDSLNRVFSGDSGALAGLNVSHVLCSSETMPDYLTDWEKEGRIKLVAASMSEGWRLYRNHSDSREGADR